MENNDNIIISRYAFERMQAKDERNDTWRNVIIILLIVLLVLSNGLWLWYESQFEYVVEDYTEVDSGEGNINYIGHNGDINNGESNTPQDSNEAQN